MRTIVFRILVWVPHSWKPSNIISLMVFGDHKREVLGAWTDRLENFSGYVFTLGS